MALALNMDLGAISARAGAPNDGLKKGANDSERVAAGSTEIALWSKQNSDATGMRYQWGRKDPFTFATNSEKSGTESHQIGKYPVKLYNSSNVLIHQVDNGGDNTNSKPSGGVLSSSINASSMSVAVANPTTYYANPVINQSGQSSDLYNYYFASYSRGTDGAGGAWNVPNKFNWHNDYLDSYIPSRHKSIYDPCPYGYRIPSNGTYNEFTNPGWKGSYVGGILWGITWLSGTGWRSTIFEYSGTWSFYNMSTSESANYAYRLGYNATQTTHLNGCRWGRGYVSSIRCIEDCSVVSDATEASAGY